MKTIVLFLFAVTAVSADCEKSVTTVSGAFAPKNTFCKGDLIFSEDFNNFNTDLWQHEITMSGGGNWEFEWYVNNRSNSFVKDGNLHIRPTLTEDVIGDITNCHIQLNPCTESSNGGCEHWCSRDSPVNPIQSARLRTVDTFSFKYGRAEVVAKLPTGDWLWPAIWFLPSKKVYGEWPRSGEIDLMESKGNAQLFNDAGHNIGVEEFGSTLHFGTIYYNDAWWSSSYPQRSPVGNGWNNHFHAYQLEWTPDHITFSVDNVKFATVPVGDGFFKRGYFSGENPWAGGTLMAPFDEEFHFVFNLAVGGVNGFFPETGNRNGQKPWKNNSWRAAADFWEGRSQWLPTWNLENNPESASLLIDSVKVWAV